MLEPWSGQVGIDLLCFGFLPFDRSTDAGELKEADPERMGDVPSKATARVASGLLSFVSYHVPMADNNQTPDRKHQARIPQGIATFLATATVMNALGLAVQLLLWRLIQHRAWPYRSPLLEEKPAVDLTNFAPLFAPGIPHTPAFFHQRFPFMYPAAVAPLYGFFFSFRDPVPVFQDSLVALSIAAFAIFAWRLSRAGVHSAYAAALTAGVFCLSYPLAFEFKQGNMELFVALLVGGAVWLFWREHFHSAAALFAIAAAMKIFPFVYLALFVSRRKWRPIATAIAVGSVITLLSLLYLSPHPLAAWHGINTNLKIYRTDVAFPRRRETGYDHSLFGLSKVAYAVTHQYRDPPSALMERVLRLYLPTAAAGGILIWVVRIRKLPFANQLLCLTIASITLSPVSFDYTLIHLYIPLGVLTFFAWQERERYVSGLHAIFFCLALLTATESEMMLDGRSAGGQFKAVVLIFTFVASLAYPFSSTLRSGDDLDSR